MTATALPDRPGEVVIESIVGDGGRLSLEAPKNCVGETLRSLPCLPALVPAAVAGAPLLRRAALPAQPSCPALPCTWRASRPCSALPAAAGIAAIETLKLLPGAPSCGVSLRLHKGLPLGSGMGSSAASAAAAAWAVNSLFGCPVGKDRLIYAGLASEAAVSGYHADNIAPALMGGFVLIR